MALVVEDGTIVANANSYVSRAEAIAFATARGKAALFPDTVATDQFLVLAADYIESKTGYLGYATDEDQALSWPRTDVYLNGYLLDDNAIPLVLKTAQIEIALLIAAGIDITGVSSGKFKKRVKVGPIETEYSEAVGFGLTTMPMIDALLAKLLGFAAGSLRTYRV